LGRSSVAVVIVAARFMGSDGFDAGRALSFLTLARFMLPAPCAPSRRACPACS
jgi:hypothetical protein